MTYLRRFARVLILTGLFGCLSAGAGAQTSGAGTVTGSLTINGKTELLRYAYAMSERDTDNPKKETVRVVLTNQPLPEKVTSRLTTAALMGFREDNKPRLWGILVELRPPEKRMAFLAVFGPVGGTTMSPVLESRPQKLSLTMYKADRVAGRLTMTQPDTFAFPTEGTERRATYRFTAAFDIPVRPIPLPQVLTGAAARDSDPAKAVAAFVEAARKGDSAGLRRYLSAPVAKRLEAPDRVDMLSAFQRMAAILKMEQLHRVLISGDRATVEFKTGPGETASLEMVRENGEWKVGA